MDQSKSTSRGSDTFPNTKEVHSRGAGPFGRPSGSFPRRKTRIPPEFPIAPEFHKKGIFDDWFDGDGSNDPPSSIEIEYVRHREHHRTLYRPAAGRCQGNTKNNIALSTETILPENRRAEHGREEEQEEKEGKRSSHHHPSKEREREKRKITVAFSVDGSHSIHCNTLIYSITTMLHTLLKNTVR